ncbi:MAG: hypothetical protein ACTSPT_06640 [Candidatus Heimdallarchaeota archaeon]
MTLSGKISVGGTIVINGILRAKEVSAGGEIRAQETHAEYIKIGKRGTIEGAVYADKIVISSRATAEDLYGGEIILEERCRVRNVHGNSIYIEEGARVSGKIEYIDEINIEKGAQLSNEPKQVKK